MIWFVKLLATSGKIIRFDAKNAIIAAGMKYYFLFWVSMLWAGTVAAQVAVVKMSGTLLMATGEEFPYKIDAIDSNGVLKGYAYTYSSPDQTKVSISGKIDKQQRKLTFKEVEILESHDVQTKAFMCLIHASLEYKQGVLSGPVTSRESDNTACTPGTLTFRATNEINELFASHDKYDMVVTMGGNREQPKPKVEPQAATTVPEGPMVTDRVTSGVEKTYDWYTDTLVIDVWDGGNFDGDMVTIEFDGNPVLKRFVIDKPKKRIRVPITDNGVHTLAIIADNEGSDPPNTASMLLTDGDRKYSILAYNNKGQESMIKIKKVQAIKH